MHKITVKYKANPGEKVLVQNYKSKFKPWESGVVRDVEISIDRHSGYRISYRVCLDREAPSGGLLFLTVGDSGIKADPQIEMVE